MTIASSFTKISWLSMTISIALFLAVIATVVRERKIRIALITNQFAAFVTVPSWGKNIVEVF